MRNQAKFPLVPVIVGAAMGWMREDPASPTGWEPGAVQRPGLQRAVHREQPYEQVRALMREARRLREAWFDVAQALEDLAHKLRDSSEEAASGQHETPWLDGYRVGPRPARVPGPDPRVPRKRVRRHRCRDGRRGRRGVHDPRPVRPEGQGQRQG